MTGKIPQLPVLLVLRFIGVGLQLLVQLIVGSVTGPAGLGLLQTWLTWTCVAGEAVAMGYPGHSMKTLAATNDAAGGRAIQSYLKKALAQMAKSWLAILLLTALPALFLAERSGLIITAATSVLVFAALRLFSESLKALRCASAGVFLENSGAPLVLLVCLAAAFLADVTITPSRLILFYALGFLISMFAMGIVLRGKISRLGTHKTAMLTAHRSELLPLWGTGLLSILFLHFPFLIMPYFASNTEVGQFAIAFKLINLVSTLLILLAAIYGPRFARQFAAGDFRQLAATLWKSQLSALLLYVPVVAILLFFAQPIIRVFGEGFQGAQAYLWILAAGHLVNAATGLPGLLLNMGGAGRIEFRCLAVTLTAAGIAAVPAGLAAGCSGIAVVYTLAVAGKNISSYILARHFMSRRPGSAINEVLS